MSECKWLGMLVLCALGSACSRASSPPSPYDANAGIDSLNSRLVQTYRDRDPVAYGRLYTDSAIFEWPAFTSGRGPGAMEALARANWTNLSDMDLRLIVSSRHIAESNATEFGAFEQSYRDSSGTRMIEFGRYVTHLTRDRTGWLIARFFGFADSTRPAPSTR